MACLDKSGYEGPYVLSMGEPERHAFNLLFSRLDEGKDVDLKTARKWLSGARIGQDSSKATKDTIQTWLRRWHRAGLLTMLHGRVRLGSLSLCLGVLDEYNILAMETKAVQQADGDKGLRSLMWHKLEKAGDSLSDLLESYKLILERQAANR